MAREDNAYRKRRARGPSWLLIAALGLLAFALALYLLREREGAPPGVPPPLAETATPTPPAPTPLQEGSPTPTPGGTPGTPAAGLPTLNESDAQLREQAAGLSGHASFAAWLANRDLVRRFVASVDNVAAGISPKPHLAFLAPRSGFSVVASGGSLRPDPRSYARYDRVADVVAGIDAGRAAALYRRFQPLCEAAYRELGYGERAFDATLRAAIFRLLRTPVVQGVPALEPRVVSYAYRDPELESLSPAAKQFLRMGPRNVQRIQGKLRELARALGIPEAELPPPSVHRVR